MLAWGKADAGASLLCYQGPRRHSQDLVQKDLETQLKINLSALRGLALSVLGPEDSPKGRAWERNTIYSASTPPFQSSLAPAAFTDAIRVIPQTCPRPMPGRAQLGLGRLKEGTLIWKCG